MSALEPESSSGRDALQLNLEEMLADQGSQDRLACFKWQEHICMCSLMYGSDKRFSAVLGRKLWEEQQARKASPGAEPTSCECGVEWGALQGLSNIHSITIRYWYAP
jgi:hypothetical protein